MQEGPVGGHLGERRRAGGRGGLGTHPRWVEPGDTPPVGGALGTPPGGVESWGMPLVGGAWGHIPGEWIWRYAPSGWSIGNAPWWGGARGHTSWWGWSLGTHPWWVEPGTLLPGRVEPDDTAPSGWSLGTLPLVGAEPGDTPPLVGVEPGDTSPGEGTWGHSRLSPQGAAPSSAPGSGSAGISLGQRGLPSALQTQFPLLSLLLFLFLPPFLPPPLSSSSSLESVLGVVGSDSTARQA